ncbi:MAG: serine/threonine-protein kinase, partial [Myxococcota bacterium]
MTDHPTHSAHTPDAPAPPRRHPLASAIDRQRALASLFGKPFEPITFGRFTLIEHIGTGGMGEVFAAYDGKLDRRVAIKLVRASTARTDSARADLSGPGRQAQARLIREAKTLAQLSHPNIIHVYDVDQVDGLVYIAMEYVRGQTLRAWLERLASTGRRDRQRTILRLFDQAGRGLAAVHKAGLVHRDFKPDNALVGDDGRPRVVDFGLARVMNTDHIATAELTAPPQATATASADHDTAALAQDGAPLSPLRSAAVVTRPGQVVGTLLYMAPEQLDGQAADQRSDQFSFCVALYEALCGQLPFRASSDRAMRAAIARGCPPPPASARVPAPIRRALERGLAEDPAERFADMGALLDALRAWPRGRQRAMLALALTAVLGAGGAAWVLSADAPELCAAAGQPMTALWTADRRAALAQSFTATGLAHAPATWHSLERRIDVYAATWMGESAAACRATHVLHTQSESLLDRRTACLDHGQRQLAAVLDRFAV